MNCRKFSKLIVIKTRLLPEADRQEIEKHLKLCNECRLKWDAKRHLEKFVRHNSPANRAVSPDLCYDELKLLTHLQGGLKRHAREELILHLTQCSLCLDNLIAQENLLSELRGEDLIPDYKGAKEMGREMITGMTTAVLAKLRDLWNAMRLPKPAYRLVGVAMVVTTALFILIWPEDTRKIPFVRRELSESHSALQIQLLSPARKSVVEVQSLDFRWAGPPDISSYNFLLVDLDGDIVWKKVTLESSLTLPGEIILQPNMTYFWQVEGRFESGTTLLSVMARFTTDLE